MQNDAGTASDTVGNGHVRSEGNRSTLSLRGLKGRGNLREPIFRTNRVLRQSTALRISGARFSRKKDDLLSFRSCFPTLSDRCRKIVIFSDYCFTATLLSDTQFFVKGHRILCS